MYKNVIGIEQIKLKLKLELIDFKNIKTLY